MHSIEERFFLPDKITKASTWGWRRGDVWSWEWNPGGKGGEGGEEEDGHPTCTIERCWVPLIWVITCLMFCHFSQMLGTKKEEGNQTYCPLGMVKSPGKLCTKYETAPSTCVPWQGIFTQQSPAVISVTNRLLALSLPDLCTIFRLLYLCHLDTIVFNLNHIILQLPELLYLPDLKNLSAEGPPPPGVLPAP